MCQDCSLEASELLRHCRKLEHENATLRGAVRQAICGNVLNPGTSCQLHRNHTGLHTWADATSDVLIRWA